MSYKNLFPNRVSLFVTAALIMSGFAYSQEPTKAEIIRSDETQKATSLESLSQDFKREYLATEKNIQRFAKVNGLNVTETLANGNQIELVDIGPDGTPLYYSTFSDHASEVSRANTLYDGGLLNLGLSGKGMSVGLWDAGKALITHQEYASRVMVTDEADAVSAHATMVLGAMISKGIKSKAKGVAFNANATTNDWKADKVEVATAAAAGLLLSNHSYGIRPDFVPDWYFGAYIQVSQDWDKIMYNAPYYLMVTAAGNAQKLNFNDAPIFANNTDGFDLLLGFSTSKNGINVAAVETEVDLKGNLKKAYVANYSSHGPTDDGRIKPDIAGSGANIVSTQSATNTSYDTYSGTSMAAPGVTSTMLLLQEYYLRLHNRYMKAATLKGLVLHSADDVDVPGPDYKMGWGVINAKTAAEIITTTDYSSFIIEASLKENEVYSVTVDAKVGESLLASISWTDPVGNYINKGNLNDATPALVNDLDIRITKNNETYYPWLLNPRQASSPAKQGDNTVDPFEKIKIDKASGTYTITVSHKGKITNGVQNFSLIVSGAKVTACEAKTPQNFKTANADASSIELTWDAITDAIFEVQYKAENDSDWQILFTDKNSLKLQDLTLDENYEVKVRTNCTASVFSDFSESLNIVFKGIATAASFDLELQELSLVENLKFSVYPNPTTEKITIKGQLSNRAFYSIVSSNGIIQKKGKAAFNSIDVEDLSSGFYSLTIFEDGEQQSMKFIKN